MAPGEQKAKLLVIVGPTASGKSALAMKIAKQYRGEIICADSLTVRKFIDIGSAKPSQKEQKEIPHHLLDVAEPCADFTAAVFKGLAKKVISDVQKRGKLPILAGGTGLYIDSVLFDYQFLPAGDRREREKLNLLSLAELTKEIEVRGIDSSGLDMQNKRRLIRLLETGGVRPTRAPIRPDALVIGIDSPRGKQRQAIKERVDKMISAGLEQEVAGLKDRFGWDCEALKGIGYREWRDYFDGGQSLTETIERIIKSTLDLAKKQRTWFKRGEYIKWFTTIKIAENFLHKELLSTKKSNL